MEWLAKDETEVWTTEANAPLARFASRVDTIAGSGLDSLGLPESTLRRLTDFDAIFSWYGTNRAEFREAVGHLPFQFFPALPKEGCRVPAVDYYLSQVGAPSGLTPRLPVARRNDGYAVIHPFSGGRRKNWPIANYRRVAAALDMPVCWSAGPEESLEGATRFDSLWDLAEWLAGASLYVGNDSGITHLAAACGVPVIAIFIESDPVVWAPRGEAVTVVDRPQSVDEVISASRRRLRGSSPPE